MEAIAIARLLFRGEEFGACSGYEDSWDDSVPGLGEARTGLNMEVSIGSED